MYRVSYYINGSSAVDFKEFENFEKINAEYTLFKSISKQATFGTRMHYIRKNEQTFSNMAKAGYCFDSSEMSFKAPYKIGQMWEFPFQIMDGYIIEKPKKWQSKNFQSDNKHVQRLNVSNSANINGSKKVYSIVPTPSLNQSTHSKD